MNDSESELPGVNIEAIFPHHIARVRSEMDKDRAEEYVRKGNKLLNGLIWTFVTAVLLFSHTLADLFSFMQDLETQILIGIFTIYAIVLVFNLFRFTADFYDVPAVSGIWKNAGLIILLLYFLSAGIYYYGVAENNGSIEEKASDEAAAEAPAYEWIERVDIPVAGISIPVPESCQGIAWKRRDRNVSDFTMAFRKFQVSVEVRTVYTSETAALEEFEDEFCYVMDGLLGKRPSVRPGIHTINGHRYLAATGVERATHDNVLVRYMTIHKGARFDLNVTMPAGSHVPDASSLIEDIVSSVTFYDPVP